MSGVFISYRRDDAPAWAGRLYDLLSREFGADRVFMDIDDIPIGADFQAHIDGTLDQCAAVLVIIGPRWLAATDGSGRRRLDDPDDVVVAEVGRALERDTTVIPVLVDTARMPTAADLPPSVERLAARNALQLSVENFRFGADVLIERLPHLLDHAQVERRTRTSRLGRRPVIAAALAAAVVVIAGVLLLWPSADTGRVGTDIEVNEDPLAMDGGGDSLWVVSAESTLEQIDPESSDVVHTGDLRGLPVSVVAAGDSVWVANDGQVDRFDSLTHDRTRVSGLESEPTDLAIDDEALWVASIDGVLARVDPETHRVTDRREVGRRLSAVASGEEGLWVSDYTAGVASRIDPTTLETEQTVPVGRQPSAVAVGGGSVWVASEENERVIQIDPEAGRPRDIRVGHAPSGLTVGEDALWVVDRDEGTVARFDLDSGERVAELLIEVGLNAVVAGHGAVWVAGEQGDVVTRLELGEFEG